MASSLPNQLIMPNRIKTMASPALGRKFTREKARIKINIEYRKYLFLKEINVKVFVAFL